MSKRMITEQLEAIRKRTEAATAGKWEIYEKPDGTHIGTSWNHPQLKSPLPIVSFSIYAKEPHHRIYITEKNAEFITHAREDVPALLAEIEYRREKQHEAIKYNQFHFNECKRLSAEVEYLRSNIKTVESMTSCEDTRDFAQKALSGDASIEI